MRYSFLMIAVLIFSCNTSSTEKGREVDSAKVDGTRLTDTLPLSDSVPPNIQNLQPD